MKKIMLKNIPDDLARDFKVKCAQEGITQNAALLKLMADAMKKGEKRVGL